MFMHSYGGVVGCSAIENLGLKSRKAKGLERGVAHLVTTAAFILPGGTTVFDIGREMGEGQILSTAVAVVEDRAFFSTDAKIVCFGDVPGAEAERIVRTLSPASIDCIEDKALFEGWRHVWLTFITTTKDITLLLHYQRRILQKRENAAAEVNVLKLATGHSPWVSKTDEVVKIINDVANDTA